MNKLLLALPLAALAACAPADRPSPGFGDAVRHNIAAQVVNPDANLADLPPPEMEGERTRGAFERYQADKVKRPVPLGTTTVIKGANGK
jgi:hypothetical protein